jgi:hypothetical protein
MKSHEVLRKAFKKVGCKNVARELKLSLSTIHKWTEPVPNGGSGLANPLDKVEQLMTLTGDIGLLEYLCAQAGGQFVPQSEMPSLMRRWWGQMKADMERLLKLGQRTARLKETAGQETEFPSPGLRASRSPGRGEG